MEFSLIISNSLAEKLDYHNIVLIDYPTIEEELERHRLEAQLQFEQEMNDLMIRRAEQRQREIAQMSAEERYFTFGITGDRALDADSDEELLPTEELTEELSDNDEILEVIDFTDDTELDKYFE